MFSFSDPADPDLVFIENSGATCYLEDTDRTQRYRLIFSHLQAAALNPVRVRPDSDRIQRRRLQVAEDEPASAGSGRCPRDGGSP